MKNKLIQYINHYNQTSYTNDIILYGFLVLIYNINTELNFILLTFLFNELEFGFTFIPIFSYLRIKYGGYHCQTPLKCIIYTNSMFILTIFIIKLPIKILMFILAIVFFYILKKFINDNIIHFHPQTIIIFFLIYITMILLINSKIFLGLLTAVCWFLLLH